jgi:hypothetical protein
MTWNRATFANALAEAIRSADTTATVSVFAAPPTTVNPPAVIVAHPSEVRYGVAALGTDESDFPVICVGTIGGEDVIDGLIALVIGATMDDPTIGGAVQSVAPEAQRNWRAVKIGGADYLAADVALSVRM